MKMIKKDKVKGFISGVILTLMLVSTVGVFASGQVSKKVEVFYNNIKLVIDGKPVEFGKDSVGAKIEPFIYNGTTYLPVRAVGEAMGKKVNWDGITQTVYLGERQGEVSYMTETVDPYAFSNAYKYTLDNSTKLKIGGKEYNTGYKLQGYSYIMFNLDGKYTEIKGMLGASDWKYLNNARDMDIYLDGKLYKTITIDPEKLPEEIIIPVKGVMQIKFELDSKNVSTYIGFGDVIIK